MKGNAAVSSVDVQTQKYLTLLELSKAIASHRDLSELFHDIACRLRNLFPFRDLAVMLHDGRAKRDARRISTKDAKRPIGPLKSQRK